MHYLLFKFLFPKLPFRSSYQQPSPVSMSSEKHREQKKEQFFWFSLGVLHGFSQKSNKDEFSWKSNRGWRPLEQIQKTQGVKKRIFFGFPWGFCMDFLGNQTRMNFPENRMGAAMARTDPENTRSKKKAYNISEILEIKGNFENVNMNSK